jgi:hypothetical protein
MKVFSGIWVPHPPAYKEKVGLEYAQALARKTQGLSLVLNFTGWLFVVFGALLAIGGSVLGSEEASVASKSIWAELLVHRGLLCSTLAIVCAGAGWQILDRASAATKVASISTRAILIASTNEEDSKADKSAYDACVKAKTAWLEGRMNNDRLENIVDTLAPSKSKPNG